MYYPIFWGEFGSSIEKGKEFARILGEVLDIKPRYKQCILKDRPEVTQSFSFATCFKQERPVCVIRKYRT